MCYGTYNIKYLSLIHIFLDVIGFKIVEKHNGYTENEVTPDTERIVYIVKK